jgi:hypothetical protein
VNGPAHYEHAEIAQDAAAQVVVSRPGHEYTAAEALLDALVHATLALAAASTLTSRFAGGRVEQDEWEAWVAVLGVEQS